MKKITKTIHYCWFGRGKKSDFMMKCINSWKKYLPDYVRLLVLYNYGGIYMDTDVEIIKNIDVFLDNNAFSSFENNNYIPTGIMAAKKGNKWIKMLLDEYDDLKFIKDDGTFDLTTNVIRITEATIKNYNLIPNDTFQDLGDVVLYPHDYFWPKNWFSGKIEITSNTYAIHHFNGSWHSKREQRQNKKRVEYINKYGVEKGTHKYNRYLKFDRYVNFITYPFKALKNPKKALKIIFRR